MKYNYVSKKLILTLQIGRFELQLEPKKGKYNSNTCM